MAWSRLLFFCLRCARALAARSVPSIMAWHGPCLRLSARMVRGIAELWPGYRTVTMDGEDGNCAVPRGEEAPRSSAGRRYTRSYAGGAEWSSDQRRVQVCIFRA